MRKTMIAMFAALILVMATAASAAPGQSELAQVRKATAKYHKVSTAIDEGLGPFSINAGEEITCFDDPAGGMGVHYVRDVGDGEVDPLNPEAMVYEITRSGKLKLVGVEYVVLQSEFAEPPELFGQPFTPKTFDTPDGPLEIYKLHAWIWKANPNGMFVDFNPLVADCPDS